MKKLILSALIGISMNACFFDDDEDTVSAADQSAAQTTAESGMNKLMAVDPMTMSESSAQTIRADFKTALDKDPNNGMANLGMALSLLMSVQYDQEVKNEFGTSSGSFASQGTLLARVSKWTVSQADQSQNLEINGTNMLGAPRLQSYIETKLLARLDSAKNFISKAISNQGSSDWVFITNERDTVEIDKGDLYVARAGLNATHAALSLACLYDLEFKDASGSMNWIDQAKSAAHSGNDALSDSIVASVIKTNLDRPAFLTWRAGKSPATIKSDLLNGIEDLKSAASFIRTEKDDQNHDLIKQSALFEMDSDYATNVSGENGFTGNKVDDALNRIKDIVNGATIPMVENGVSFNVKPAALLDPGIKDLKKLLPLYKWNAPANWNKVDTIVYNAGQSYEWTSIERSFEPVYLVDENGVEVNDPVFTDYTFGGVLPDMTKAKFQQINP